MRDGPLGDRGPHRPGTPGRSRRTRCFLWLFGIFGLVNQPPDNPYRRTHDEDNAEHAIAPDDPHLADAERAVAADTATPEQQREVRISTTRRQTHQYDLAWENYAHDHSRDEVTELRKLERTESAYPERAGREERGG